MRLLKILKAVLIITTVAFADVEINETNFPDENFRKWLLNPDKIDGYGIDGILTYEEIANITYINVNPNMDSNEDIFTDLTGIEHFTALTNLNCGSNQLTKIDISKNTALEILHCYQNPLSKLDVSKNIALEWLICWETQLTELDVSKNINLEKLQVIYNQIAEIDLTHNTLLRELDVRNNELTELDISNNTVLEWVRTESNHLSALDLTKIIDFESLDFNGSSQTVYLALSGNNNSYSVDISLNNPKNLSAGVTYENGKLTVNNKNIASSLFTVETGISGENISGTFFFTYEECRSIQINETNFPDANFRNWILAQDYGNDAILTCEEIDGITAINVMNKNISDLTGIEYFTVLEYLSCSNNQLTYLDVSGLKNLGELYCENNQLTELDVTESINLVNLYCFDNQLASLNVRGLKNLDDFRCHNNKLTSLDITGLTNLFIFICSNNQLTELDVSTLTNLSILLCDDNQLTELDVITNLKKLSSLYCRNNQLSKLDLTGLADLPERFMGTGQTVPLALEYKKAYYGVDIELNNPTNLAEGIRYENGILTSNDKNITSSPFTVETGLNDEKLSGTFFFTYGEECESVPVNSSNFPDDNFRNWILAQDYGNDAILTCEEIDGITAINVMNKNISDLTGIEHFTALTDLNCNSNKLTALDISNNTELTGFSCANNQITAVDVSMNTKLELLNCALNQLTSIDLSKNTELTLIDLSENYLTSLDVSNNSKIGHLYCPANHLYSIDLLNKYNLRTLEGENQTVSLTLSDIGNGLYATAISLNNPINLAEGIRYENGMLISESSTIASSPFLVTEAFTYTEASLPLNLSGTFFFTYEECLPIEINETNFPNISFRNWLMDPDNIYGYGSDGILTCEEIENIKEIDVGYKNIPDLRGIEHFTELEKLGCWNNQMISLDVSKNINLTELVCNINKLSSLDVSKNINLKKLDCSTNLLTEINVSQNTELLELWCYGNQITSLDVSNNAKLDALYCHRNLIGELDVSENIHLTRLDCSTNELTEIDISLNTGLKDFLCHKNQLTELDVSKNTLLENLWCNDNHLSALDLTGFSSFNYFDGKNQTVYLTLYGTNNNYSTAISLNNPTKLASGITYSDGILTSNSSAISSSPFAVETELDRHNLSGTFFFTYLHCEEWSDWTINKEPTCEEPGIKTRTRICSGSVETDWEIIPALGGDWGEWSEWTEVLPTCTEPGYRTRTRTDRTCGNIDTETEVLPALGHDWDDWKTIKEPDCEEEGIMERICLRNPAHKETVSIPKLTDCGKKDNGKFIIVKNPVYDKAEMFVILPEDETLTELRIVIFDAVGNIVFENKTVNCSSDNPMIWDLRNREKRLVSSGTYLIVAEAKSVEDKTADNKKHRYSAKLMVKK